MLHCGAAYSPFSNCIGDIRDHYACVGAPAPLVEDDHSKLLLANFVRHVTKMACAGSYILTRRKLLEPSIRRSLTQDFYLFTRTF